MDFNDKIFRSSLHIEVADRVRDMIFDRSLPPGFRIDELDLSAKLGTSRTPLREALKVLANEGLVRLAPGRGAFVTELSPQEVDSLFPVLALLEARCTAEAVRRQTAGDVRRLSAIHQRMETHVAGGEVEPYHQATDELHHQLHLVAGNPWLLRATSDLRRFLRLARGMTQHSDARLLHSLAEHRTLMRAIARGDAESAEQVMHHHLLAQQKAWRLALASQQREAAAEAAEAAAAAAAADVAEDADIAEDAVVAEDAVIAESAVVAESAAGPVGQAAAQAPGASEDGASMPAATATRPAGATPRSKASAEHQPEVESVGV
jgi:DNA-binding GntR family transcriptional regulator